MWVADTVNQKKNWSLWSKYVYLNYVLSANIDISNLFLTPIKILEPLQSLV